MFEEVVQVGEGRRGLYSVVLEQMDAVAGEVVFAVWKGMVRADLREDMAGVVAGVDMAAAAVAEASIGVPVPDHHPDCKLAELVLILAVVYLVTEKSLRSCC